MREAKTAVEYYEARAEEYDDFCLGLGQFADQRRQIESDVSLFAPHIRAFGAGRILDVGCGTSFFAQFYSEDAGAILGVDASLAMLSETRKRFASIRVRAWAVRADVLSLPLGPRTFDRCFVGFLMSHLQDDEIAALADEMRRVLSGPNARIAIVDSAWTCARQARGSSRFGLAQRRLNDGRTFEVFKRYFTGEELEAVLTGAGLSLRRLMMGQLFICAICAPGRKAN